MSSLEILFDQIISSERLAEERRNYLLRVKNEIKIHQNKMKEIENETESLKEQFVLKMKQLNEEDLKLKWLLTKEHILSKQIKKLQSKKEEFTEQIDEMKEKITKERDTFISEAKEFRYEHSLFGDQVKSWEEKAKEQLACIDKEEESLLNELMQFKQCKQSISEAEIKRDELKSKLQEFITQHQDLEKEFQNTNKKAEQLEKEKLMVSKIPENNPEFQSIQAELMSLHNSISSYEQTCLNLQCELKLLQQEVWKKNVQNYKQQPTASYIQVKEEK